MKTIPSLPQAQGPNVHIHYKPLDGLRGVAVLFVLLFHNFYYLRIFRFGWVGVDIFFVLSGFLITTTFLKDREKPHAVLSFYLKRVLRIFPLYYASLLVLLLLIPPWIHKLDPAFYGQNLAWFDSNQIWFWTFTENWLYIFKKPPASGASYLTHFWSLGLEEQYYLVWPWVLLRFNGSRSLVRCIVAALCLMLAARFMIWKTAGPDFLFFFFNFTRIEGLALGSLLAIGTHFGLDRLGQKLLTATGIALIFCSLTLLAKACKLTTIPFFGFGGYLLIGLLTALLIHFLLHADFKTPFSHPLLVAAGRISFGLYVIHWPLYFLLDPVIQSFSNGTGSRVPLSIRLLSSVVCLLLSGLLAYSSYTWFEKYFLNLKKRLPF
jgi:peptidoglycan/LPS O-acetylase OafA/YrhL